MYVLRIHDKVKIRYMANNRFANIGFFVEMKKKS